MNFFSRIKSWESPIESWAVKAISAVTDIDELKLASKKSEYISVRKIAVEKLLEEISDNDFFTEAFNNETVTDIRRLIITKIDDFMFLFKILIEDKEKIICDIAQAKLILLAESQNIIKKLKYFAENAEDFKARRVAVEILTVKMSDNDNFFIGILKKEDELPYTRSLALKKITCFDLLVQIASENNNGENTMREEIKNKFLVLDNNQKLVNIFKCYKNPDVYKASFDFLIEYFCDVIKSIENKYQNKHLPHFRDDETLIAYTLASLGKIISYECSVQNFKDKMTAYDGIREILNSEVDDYNEIIETSENDEDNEDNNSKEQRQRSERIRKYRGELRDYKKHTFPALFDKFNEKERNIYTNFVKQCVITGLFDFLYANKNDDFIRKYYDILSEFKTSIILGTNSLDCFEIRPPYAQDFSKEDYIFILEKSLYCINPEKQYNISNFIEVAEEEIPQALELLMEFPLKIIDSEEIEIIYTAELLKLIQSYRELNDKNEVLDEKITDFINKSEESEEEDEIIDEDTFDLTEDILFELRNLFCHFFPLLQLEIFVESNNSSQSDKYYFFKDVHDWLERISESEQIKKEEVRLLKSYLEDIEIPELQTDIKIADELIEIVDEYYKLINGLFKSVKLIRDANNTLGTFHYNAADHQRWFRYNPPLGKGQVTKRYHIVNDITRPNSIGINANLFIDGYSVIPTLYHEYCHYAGDLNEASVFLKTHLFSIYFYKRHSDIIPRQSFYILQNILGYNVDADKFEELNKYIVGIYGKRLDENEAIRKVERDIYLTNNWLIVENNKEKWCPEIKYPLLAESHSEEYRGNDIDIENYEKLKSILVRFAQIPREISKEEFINIKSKMNRNDYYSHAYTSFK